MQKIYIIFSLDMKSLILIQKAFYILMLYENYTSLLGTKLLLSILRYKWTHYYNESSSNIAYFLNDFGTI